MAAAALPEEVLAFIYALLTAPEIAAAACVCRAWRAAAASPALWRGTFVRLLGPQAAAALSRLAATGSAAPDWRAALADRYRAGAGWRDAKCRVHTLEGANQDAELFKIADDHLISCNSDGSIHVRPLERRAGGQRRPKQLRAHTSQVTTCDVDVESGLVLTASEDGSVCLWRGAAALLELGEAAQVGTAAHDVAVAYAWVLPLAHLARFRAGALCAEGADAPADAPPRWRGPSALVVCALSAGNGAPPEVEQRQRCVTTVWEFPLAGGAPAGAGEPLPPPPRLVATWRDVYLGPPATAQGGALLGQHEDERMGFVGPTLCRASAALACITAHNRLALRDVVTGDVRRLRSLDDVPADQLRNVIADEHPAGACHILLESLEQQFTLLDADADVALYRFSLPMAQLPIMYSDRLVAWLPPSARYLLTGEVVELDWVGTRSGDAARLRAATQRDGATCVCSPDAERGVVAALRANQSEYDGPPSVVLFRVVDCLTGAAIARTALPPLRAHGPLLFNSNVVTSDALIPGSPALRTLLVAPDARGQARLLLWGCDGRTLALPAAAAVPPREVLQANALQPFAFGVVEAVSWRWAVVSEYAVFGFAGPGNVTVLDFMSR